MPLITRPLLLLLGAVSACAQQPSVGDLLYAPFKGYEIGISGDQSGSGGLTGKGPNFPGDAAVKSISVDFPLIEGSQATASSDRVTGSLTFTVSEIRLATRITQTSPLTNDYTVRFEPTLTMFVLFSGTAKINNSKTTAVRARISYTAGSGFTCAVPDQTELALSGTGKTGDTVPLNFSTSCTYTQAAVSPAANPPVVLPTMSIIVASNGSAAINGSMAAKPYYGVPVAAAGGAKISLDTYLPSTTDPIFATPGKLPIFYGSGKYTSAVAGNVVLVLKDEQDKVVWSSARRGVQAGTDTTYGDQKPFILVDSPTTPTFPSGIPGSLVAKLFLQALLLDSNASTELASSSKIPYNVYTPPQASLQLRLQEQDGIQTPVANITVIRADTLLSGLNTALQGSSVAALVRVDVDVPADEGLLELQVTTNDGANGSSLIYTSPSQPVGRGKNTVFFDVSNIRSELKGLDFRPQLTVTLPTGQQKMPVGVLSFQVMGVKILSEDPSFTACDFFGGPTCPTRGQSFPVSLRVFAAAKTPTTLSRALAFTNTDSETSVADLKPATDQLVDSNGLTYTDNISIKVPATDVRALRVTYVVAVSPLIFSRDHVDFSSVQSELTLTPGAETPLPNGSLKVNTLRQPAKEVHRELLQSAQTTENLDFLIELGSSRSAREASTNPELDGISRLWAFDPPIAPNTGFSASLTLNYSASDLPDDPNFSESKMQMISFDSTKRVVTVYPTVVNMAAKTATAVVDRLDAYFSLATVGPFSFQPVHVTPSATGYQVVNTAATDAMVSSTVRSSTGSGSKTSSTLRAGRSRTSNPSGSAWVEEFSDIAGVAAASWLDNKKQFAVTPSGIPSGGFIFTDVRYTDSFSTELHLANPSTSEALVTITLRKQDGTDQGSFTTKIPAKGVLVDALQDLFAGLTPGFEGYALISSTRPITASGYLYQGQTAAGLTGQLLNRDAAGVTTLTTLSAGGAGITTTLRLVNLGSAEARVTARAFGSDGAAGATSVFTITARKGYVKEIGELFGSDPANIARISVETAGNIFGDVTITLPDVLPKLQASLPLARDKSTALVAPLAVNKTTIVVTNPGTSPAKVTVKVVGTDGVALGASSTVTIPANGAQSVVLNASSAAGSYARADSDQPIVAAAFVTSNTGTIAGYPLSAAAIAPIGGGAGPQITQAGVVNAASFTTKLVRGGLATIFGSNLASSTGSATALPLPKTLAGATVTVGNVAAPLIYASPTQINFQVPFEIPPGNTTSVVVANNGVLSQSIPVAVPDYALGVFTYPRTADALDPIIVHASNNQLVSPSNPATPNEIVTVYATGIGKLSTAVISGSASPASPLASSVDLPTAAIGGSSANVIFAGLTPGLVGLIQINIALPASLPSGSLPLSLQLPGDSAAIVNLAVAGNVITSPKLSINFNSLDFGTLTAGQSKDLSLVATNSGTGSLSVSPVTVSGTGFSLVTPSSLVIDPGAARVITVRFAPLNGGLASGTLTINSNDAASPARVILNGTGIAAATPLLSLSPSSLDFGAVISGQTKDLTLTLSNAGTASLNITALTANQSFNIISPAAPLSLTPGASVLATVRFSPQAIGAAAGSLTIQSNDPGKPTATFALSGTGASSGFSACGFTLGADLFQKWTILGGQTGALGCPTSNEVEAAKSPSGTSGRSAVFQKGMGVWHRDGPFAGSAFAVTSCVASYTGTSGSYGFPLSDSYSVEGGLRTDFEGGYSTFNTLRNQCGIYPRAGDFTGQWVSTRGNLILTQDGINIAGTYGSSILEGTVSGNLLLGNYADAAASGTLIFTLSANALSFTGTYRQAVPTPGTPADWNATRQTFAPMLSILPLRLDFGTVPKGQTKDLSLIVTNQGQVAGQLITYTSSSPVFRSNAGTVSLGANSRLTVPIRFAPTDVGAVSGTIVITTSDPAVPSITVNVVGTGE